MHFYGFLVNSVTVVLGAGMGILAGSRLPDKLRTIILSGLGLSTIIIGAKMALATNHLFMAVGSVVLGGVIGQLLQIEERLENLGEKLKLKTGSSSSTFVLGFVTASLLFCAGPMTIVGSLEDGFAQKADLIYIKSLMDGVAATVLSASLGAGVLFSAITVFLVQGALTAFGSLIGDFISENILNEIGAVGGFLILGIGFNLLTDAKIRVGNFIPALGVVALMAWFII